MSASPGGLPDYSPDGVRRLIAACNEVRDQGANETVVRQTLVAQLSDAFPDSARLWWIVRHIRGAESYLQYPRDGEQGSGSADSVVGLTAIEYKPDLRRRAHLLAGEAQLRGYAAGLLNQGAQADECRLVLSDGVEWRAYTVHLLDELDADQYGPEHIEMELVEELECTSAADAIAFVSFLARYLGRDRMRSLSGPALAADFGLNSALGRACVTNIGRIIDERSLIDPQAAGMASYIRSRYASYVGTGENDEDARTEYARECYLALVSRLICANAIARHALNSPDADMDSILDGSHFDAMGLRVVEHDQFAWLFRDQVAALRGVARLVQTDLIAYDFEPLPNDDLFGELLADLADPDTRILLGQACTPVWLALRMAGRLIEMLPDGRPPRFVDMCCGSGSMLVAVTRLERERLLDAGEDPASPGFAEALAAAATGFDISPLAVLLARINWVISNRDVLGELDGSNPITPPVYHADSLFALSPVFVGEGDGSRLRFRLDDITLDAPPFLLEPPSRDLFDSLLERCRNVAAASAAAGERTPAPGVVAEVVDGALAGAAREVSDEPRRSLDRFVVDLIAALASLEMKGRDGIWSFVLGNSYRPAFYAGQFNGVLSNPPWLAMSKIRQNPFGPIVRQFAPRYGLQPPGPSAPHLDMSTVFLAHAVDRYLEEDGVVACVLPDTVRNGQHHKPFREMAAGRSEKAALRFRIEELWRVDRGTFDNVAVAVFGRKSDPERIENIPGSRVSLDHAEDAPLVVRTAGRRSAWVDPGRVPDWRDTYQGVASQGADVMPRRLVFFDLNNQARNQVMVRPITRDSDRWYLVADAKKHAAFRPRQGLVPARFTHPCLLSHHVAPFALAEPDRALLPALRHDEGWRLATEAELGVATGSRDHFRRVVRASDYDSVGGFQAALDHRRKLTGQRWSPGHWLVVYGAGGFYPAAAYVRIDEYPPILDQTLYGFSTRNEAEALYFCGVVNSRALRECIRLFVPEGQYGGRHLHTLPMDATPRYNEADEVHREVVAATEALVDELDGLRGDPEIATLFTTMIDLGARRSRVRALLEGLVAFGRYDAATRALYRA